MNETRKKIIELIEPYMFKTLGKGCVCYDKDDKEYRKISRIFTAGGEKENFDLVKEDDCYIELDGISGDISLDYLKRNYHIIGHYCITAVLSYIADILGEVKFYRDIETDKYIIETKSNRFNLNNIINLSKPIYLYTEQEDKDLLSLLLELK